MAHEIIHDEDAHRYELRVDGAVVALADYRPAADPAGGNGADVWVFHHTLTLPEHRGRGRPAEVVRAALDDVRRRGGRVVATCWFVDDFLRDHPDYADLRA